MREPECGCARAAFLREDETHGMGGLCNPLRLAQSKCRRFLVGAGRAGIQVRRKNGSCGGQRFATIDCRQRPQQRPRPD